MRFGPSARPALRAEAARASTVSRGAFLRIFAPALAASLAGPALRGVAPSLGGGAALAASDADTVAEIPASGLIFKDIIKVMRFDDPKVRRPDKTTCHRP